MAPRLQVSVDLVLAVRLVLIFTFGALPLFLYGKPHEDGGIILLIVNATLWFVSPIIIYWIRNLISKSTEADDQKDYREGVTASVIGLVFLTIVVIVIIFLGDMIGRVFDSLMFFDSVPLSIIIWIYGGCFFLYLITEVFKGGKK
jgi:hypothetical protein